MPETIYTVGGTVQAGSGFYIPRRADDELLALCRARSFAYILSPRQIGKSSLMVSTAERLAAEGIRCIIIDLTQIGVQVTAEEWYLGLLAMIEDQSTLETDVVRWWHEHAHLGLTQRLTLFFRNVLLKEIREPVVIFVDEIDTTLGLSFTDDFYAAIRYFYNARATVPEFERLSFVLIGVATPGDLIRDPQRTPFNIGQRVELTDWTFEEALPLAAGLGVAEDQARAALRQVLKWTGGHPYLTQRLCRAMIDRQQAAWTEQEIDLLVANTFFGKQSEQDNNLQFVRDMMTKRAPDLAGVLETYRDIRHGRRPVRDEEQSIVKSHLKLSGVVHREQHALRVRNPIYAEVFDNRWVKEHLPVNWPKRLQRAGVALTVAVVILLLPLSLYALNRAIVAEHQTRLAEQQTREAETNRLLAINAADRATQQRMEALKQKGIAEEQKAEADKQRQIAEAERQKAEGLRRVADEAKDKAEQLARNLAGSLKGETESRKSAEELGQIAKAQSQLAHARQLEIAANDAITRNDVLEAESYLARALLLDDRRETRARLANARIREAKLLWTSPEKEWRKSASDHEYTPLVFSPDGRLLAFVDANRIRLKNAETGEEIHSLPISTQSSRRDLVFSRDGGRLFSVDNDKVESWDVQTGKPLRPVPRSQANPATTFGSGGATLVADSDSKSITLVDAETGKELRISGEDLKPGEANALILKYVLSPDRQLLAFVLGDYQGLLDKVVVVVKVATGSRLHTIQTRNRNESILHLAFSGDNRFLAAGTTQFIEVWNLEKPSELIRLNDDGIYGIALSSDGRLAYARKDKTVRLWSIRTGKESLGLKSEDLSSEFVIYKRVVAFGPDNRLAVMGTNNAVRVWRIPRLLASDFEGVSRAVAFSPDGRLSAIGRTDHTIILQDLITGSQLHVLSGHTSFVTGLVFSPDGQLLASASMDSTVRLWDVKTGLELKGSPLLGHEKQVFGVAFSPNGRLLASAGADGGTAILWDVETRTKRREFPFREQYESVGSVAFSPDGRLLAIGTSKTLRVWDLEKNREKYSIDGGAEGWMASSLVFSRDGRTLVSGGLNKIQFWNVADGKEIVERKLTDTGVVTSVAFSKDEHWLASASKNVRLWPLDKAPETNPLILRVHNDSPWVVAFTPDGKWLASGGADRAVLFLDVGMLERTIASGAAELNAEIEKSAGLTVLGINLDPILSQEELKKLLGEEYNVALSVKPIQEESITQPPGK